MNHGEVLELIERELDSLFRQQSERASKLAHRLIPELTPEDLLNPDDYPQLLEAPEFMFEHGAACGVMSAKIALRSALKRLAEESAR
jgi:hypothetical protein